MEITNIAGLPEPLARAVRNDPYHKVGHISVTSLIKPPRMRELEQRYDEWIVEDASERIWMLLGSSVHAILERAALENHLIEERLTIDVLGWKVSGQPDLLDDHGILTDYKLTSTYSFLLGEKPEWTAQVNMYAALYREHGFEVTAAQIVGVLRDWFKSRAKREPDYPQVGVIVQPIELWSAEKQLEYLTERVRLHQAAVTMTDDELPVCTPEERWTRPDVWAVKKHRAKRALRLFTSSTEAGNYIIKENLTSATHEVEHRPGENVRCSTYCAARPFCSFGKAQAEAEA